MSASGAGLEPFPRKIFWGLLGLWIVFFGGGLLTEILNFLGAPRVLTGFLALAVAIAMVVQLVSVFKAVGLLKREPRYRSRKNIALTVAGVIPALAFVLTAMTNGLRFHL